MYNNNFISYFMMLSWICVSLFPTRKPTSLNHKQHDETRPTEANNDPKIEGT